MNVKRFEKVAKFLSVLLKLVSVLIVIGAIGFLFLFIFKRDSLMMAPLNLSFPITIGSGDFSKSAQFVASTIVVIPSMVVYFYAFFRGSQFFSRLSKGETPFSMDNYRILKEIGLIVAISNFVFPLIYSLVITLSMTNGYYILVGIDVETVVGLIIYCMAEVIRYGVILQNLSDETV